jgi:hypothetical protein
MKIKFIALMAFALFCGSFAHATPIEYRFTNASDFTLNGVSYTGPYLGIPTNAPQLTFTFYGNTDNVFTSPSIGGFPGNIHNDIGTTTVSFGGTTLATLSDPFGILISPFGSTVDLVDEANGEIILSDTIRSYNGMTNYSGPTSGGTPSSPIDTSVGQLVITGGGAYQGDFSASVGPAVPEPSAIVLLGTGALGFVGAFRRRMFAN